MAKRMPERTAGVAETPRPGEVRPQSALLAAPGAPEARAVRHLLAREHGEYTEEDVRAIVGRYWETAPAVGLDPLVVVAQMVLETGGLTSFWSQRPRRNPARIGVTGEPGVGLSFPDWATAVRAHAGRLLAYALPRDRGNARQRAIIEEALAFRPLPDHFLGAAPTIRGLVGRWAQDPRYAAGISRVANEIAGG